MLVDCFNKTQLSEMPCGGHAQVPAECHEACVNHCTFISVPFHNGGANKQDKLKRDIACCALVVAVIVIRKDMK